MPGLEGGSGSAPLLVYRPAGRMLARHQPSAARAPAPGAIVWTVHLLPAERSGHRIIDGERVCQAIAAIGPPEAVQAQAKTFAVLGDPTRLTLLIAIKAAGPISVSDLAAATGLNDTTVSQTLRYLRAAQVVSAERDGRVIRYQLADGPVAELLPQQQQSHT